MAVLILARAVLSNSQIMTVLAPSSRNSKGLPEDASSSSGSFVSGGEGAAGLEGFWGGAAGLEGFWGGAAGLEGFLACAFLDGEEAGSFLTDSLLLHLGQAIEKTCPLGIFWIFFSGIFIFVLHLLHTTSIYYLPSESL